MSAIPPFDAVPIPLGWADPTGAGACQGIVYWPPAPGPENRWRTGSAPPVAGRRDVVVVRPGFAPHASGCFWTLFEPDGMEHDGWDTGLPDQVARIRMVLCRSVAGAPGSSVGPESESGWRVLAVDVLASLSLADLAALPLTDADDGWFPGFIGSGWIPAQNPCRSEAVGDFEWFLGEDGQWLVCMRRPSGPEVLLTGFHVGSGSVSVCRRRLAADEIALLRSGIPPDRRSCAEGARSILATL